MKTQEQLVLAHLKDGSSLSPLEAIGLYSIFRLAAVVHRLRADGWNIITDNKVVYDQYDRPKPYARYTWDQINAAAPGPAPESPHRLNVPETTVVPYKAQVGDIVKVVFNDNFKGEVPYGGIGETYLRQLAGKPQHTIELVFSEHSDGHEWVKLAGSSFHVPDCFLEPIKSRHQFAQAFAKLPEATRASLQ